MVTTNLKLVEWVSRNNVFRGFIAKLRGGGDGVQTYPTLLRGGELNLQTAKPEILHLPHPTPLIFSEQSLNTN